MYPRQKRIVDLVLATTVLVLLSPLLLLIVTAFGLDTLLVRRDRGRLLYAERRISRGREFSLLKFRTLREDVLMRAAGHARPYERDVANLTVAGRLLKRWYLDELPQLFNIVRGDMSFVGPRPWPPGLVEQQMRDGVDYRNHVVAGLTGAAQVTKGVPEARYASSDLDYVRELNTRRGWSIVAYDLRLMVRTLGVLARGQGLAD